MLRKNFLRSPFFISSKTTNCGNPSVTTPNNLTTCGVSIVLFNDKNLDETFELFEVLSLKNIPHQISFAQKLIVFVVLGFFDCALLLSILRVAVDSCVHRAKGACAELLASNDEVPRNLEALEIALKFILKSFKNCKKHRHQFSYHRIVGVVHAFISNGVLLSPKSVPETCKEHAGQDWDQNGPDHRAGPLARID